MTPEEFNLIRRMGFFAKNLLADADFLDVLKGLKEDAISGWTNAKSSDEREAYWRDLHAVSRLQEKLESLVHRLNAEAVRIEKATQQQKRAALRKEELSRG